MIPYSDNEELAGALAHASELGAQYEVDDAFANILESLEFIITLSVTFGAACDKLELSRSLRELSQVIEAIAVREHQLRLQ